MQMAEKKIAGLQRHDRDTGSPEAQIQILTAQITALQEHVAQNKKDFDEFYKTFEELFNNHSVIIDDEQLKKYAKNWHRPAVAKDLDKFDPFTEEDTLVFNVEGKLLRTTLEDIYISESNEYDDVNAYIKTML